MASVTSFWEEAVDLARCISSTSVAARFRESYGQLHRELPNDTPTWKKALQTWHSTGAARCDPLWALMSSLIAMKETGEPKPPKDDPWFRQYLQDSIGLFGFVRRVIEYFRSRFPGYPHLQIIHRCRQLPHWPFFGRGITCYDPSLDQAGSTRYGPKPSFLSDGEWAAVELHIASSVQSLPTMRAYRDMKMASDEIARDQLVRQELETIVAKYDEFIKTGLKTRTRLAAYQRAREYRDRLYEEASPWTKSVFAKWNTSEELMLDLYSLISSWVSGGRIPRFSWPSSELEDVTFRRLSHHVVVQLRTSNAPELLIVNPWDILAFDFRRLDDKLSGLYSVTSKVTSFNAGILVHDICGTMIPYSRESLSRVQSYPELVSYC